MEREKIKTIFFQITLPMLIFFGGMLLTAACSKKADANKDILQSSQAMANNDSTMSVTGAKKYLALGDSYTIGTSVNETDRYPVQTAALLKAQGITASVDIIAANGWTTADLINGCIDQQLSTSYDAVSLLIGVNNQYQGRTIEEYKQQFTTLILRSIQLANGKAGHVIVLSIPDYSVTPFAKGRDVAAIAAEIDAFNAANKIIADSYKVQYLDVTADSRKAATDISLIASDGLHFSGTEYTVWSLKLARMIQAAFK